MKRTFKGFTLVECLIAMAILAIASTLMAEIYATVNTRNKFNHFNNTSLANQMAYIEKYENAATLPIYYGGLDASNKPKKDSEVTGTRKPPHEHVSTNGGESAYVQIQKLDSSGKVVTSETVGSTKGAPKYSFPVDIFIMYSRDTQNDASSTPPEKTGADGEYDVDYYEDYDKASNSRTENTNYTGIFSEQNNNLRYKYVLGHTTS